MKQENKTTLTHQLAIWEIRLNKAQIGHYIATERFLFLHRILGVPLVALSTFVSISLFLDFSQNNGLKFMIIGSSVLTSVLASLLTFLKPSELADSHRAKTAKYGSLKRKIEAFIALESASKNQINSFLQDLQMQWDNVAEDAPVTPKSVRDEISKLIQVEIDEQKNIHK